MGTLAWNTTRHLEAWCVTLHLVRVTDVRMRQGLVRVMVRVVRMYLKVTEVRSTPSTLPRGISSGLCACFSESLKCTAPQVYSPMKTDVQL